ncbi:DUF1599 domain-containing protein [Pseudoflavitalea sp. G-6-1-2]|uniref:DUF1599 domain-containing protein n=1 Tax=Pseudoflavitalea sp. G-6-1-2 TaxID=2728841 RepID=UPI00146EADD3|nr:DUF1599 domain-containing protein [Pseudoflavitalea sp. G-6-1-2]NML23971.1 DUF1599 domain-containing protein [Pseudoflavitalea sp. G-6-1-2]
MFVIFGPKGTIILTMTNQQYDEVVNACRDIFLKKTRDYGTSWRVLRPISIMDQIFIKAQRIRTIQEKKTQKVGEDITGEFKAMVNYGIIGLIQLDLKDAVVEDLPIAEVEKLYDAKAAFTREVMLAKNHDYGEAWRALSQESFTDLILTKLMRIRQILQNDGKTIISEGIDANYVDIINYSIFALILIGEGKHQG